MQEFPSAPSVLRSKSTTKDELVSPTGPAQTQLGRPLSPQVAQAVKSLADALALTFDQNDAGT